MTFENLIHFIHVLGWVCWLGTDLGVFMAARFSENTKYGVETRMAMMTLLSKLDKIPRMSIPVIFVTGVLLANNYGVDFISPTVGVAIGAVWIAVSIVAMTARPGGKIAVPALLTNLAIYLIVGAVLGVAAIMSLMGSDIMPGWLAVKWLAFAWTALFALGIDFTLKPAIGDYIRLQSEGSTDEINASLSLHLSRVYAVVLMVYAGTIVAAYFGINKVF